MDKFIEITDDDILEVSKIAPKILVDIFGQFIKTVKAKLVYPASSKLPQKFLDTLFTSLSSLLDQHDELTFKIEADAISCNETEVYRAAGKADNFAHPFFRDGIIVFRFKKGLTFDELDQFVDISSQITRSALVDDDAATLLWEAGLVHITYELMDDFLDIETFEYGTDSLKSGRRPSDNDVKKIFEKELELELTDEDFDLDSDKNKGKKVPKAYGNVEDKVAEFISNIAEYDEVEKKEIEELINGDSSFDYIKYAIDIMFEILGMEIDSAGFNETLDLIAKVGTDFVRQGDFESVIKIIDRINELGRVFDNIQDPKFDKIQEFIQKFGASEKIRVLVEYLNKSKDIEYDKVTDYLKQLSWQAIDPLVWALGELEQYPARRAVCQALEIMAQGHPDILGKGIDSPRWYVVRNIVSILGKIGDPRSFALIKRASRHSDIRVRKETILAAAKIVSNEADEFLVSALQDEEEKIQVLALKALVSRKAVIAIEDLGNVITSGDFKNRSAEQIKEFLVGYAILGGADAFKVLKGIIQHRSILPSEKHERMKAYAVRALGFIKTPDALALLENKASSRNRKLADIARRTLIKAKRGEENAW